jgi:hypothetical protein
MHKYTNPHSDISLFREYATRCLSDANSKVSREWRIDFLFKILSGTYGGTSVESNEQLSSIALFAISYFNFFNFLIAKNKA